VLEPAGYLPQPAQRLDASGPARRFELEVDVDRLYLDSTSLRNLRERAGGDPNLMAERILEIVAARGKMHNPETDSGGILLGAVAAVGERFGSPPEIGDPIITLASLTLTPLRLESVDRLEPGSPQIEVTGSAYVADLAPWGPLPDGVAVANALEVYDVYPAGSQTFELAREAETVYVLGAGHGGKLALAAARDAMSGGTVVAIDVDRDAVDRVAGLGLCDIAVTADLRDPLAALDAVRAAGAPPADLTVVVVNATGCEPTAILLTAEGGTVLFFSMATSFAAAALSPDGMSRDVRMLIGAGYAADLGAYAFDLLRRTPALRRALGGEAVSPA
jgi:L-erythro-3,5-diaminohexanoate dehydrogenase